MKGLELIDILSNMPQDIEVKTYTGDIESCEICEEYYDGDCNNPNCEIKTVVLIN